MYDVERDIFDRKENKSAEDLIYKTITGLNTDNQVNEEPDILKNKTGKASKKNSSANSLCHKY